MRSPDTSLPITAAALSGRCVQHIHIMGAESEHAKGANVFVHIST